MSAPLTGQPPVAGLVDGPFVGPFVVGIDCGSQSAKVVIYAADGTAVASAQQLLRPMHRPEPGVVEHPDDDLWDAICQASRRATETFSQTYDLSQIEAVGLCPIRCCKAFLKADGSLLQPVMSWMDDRAYQPYVPLVDGVRHPLLGFVTTASGYLAHRMTGVLSDTVANNIEMQWPIDADSWQWSTDDSVLASHGLTRDLLVDLSMPGDVIGKLSSEAAAATGLPVGVPVVATANDKAVEFLGVGVGSQPTSPAGSTVLISLGTYIAAMVQGDENRGSGTAFWTNFACVPNRYLYESSGVRRGMWTLTWFLDLLGPEFAAAAAASGLSREAYLEREAALVPAGSDGLMTVLDWLAPTDAPFRKGMMLGFDARHSRGHLYRSILEAIALSMKVHVDAMVAELNITPGSILLSGGGSSSDLFMQIFADVFGIPAHRTARNSGVGGGSGASLGAAMCAATAAGLHPSIEAASSAMSAPQESFVSDSGNELLYAQMNQTVYQHIRAATDPLFERAFPLFH
jgi:sugar (pentulose or hexulose) kinase